MINFFSKLRNSFKNDLTIQYMNSVHGNCAWILCMGILHRDWGRETSLYYFVSSQSQDPLSWKIQLYKIIAIITYITIKTGSTLIFEHLQSSWKEIIHIGYRQLNITILLQLSDLIYILNMFTVLSKYNILTLDLPWDCFTMLYIQVARLDLFSTLALS